MNDSPEQMLRDAAAIPAGQAGRDLLLRSAAMTVAHETLQAMIDSVPASYRDGYLLAMAALVKVCDELAVAGIKAALEELTGTTIL